MASAIQTTCAIAGGGPAGMMLGLLLARAGVEVVVLEKHGDFLRDFRGDTIHPSTLEVTTVAGPEGLSGPSGLAWWGDRLLVADTGNHRIQVFDFEGKFLREFPVFGWKDFYTEPYIAIGPTGSIFATDSTEGRVNEYDTAGTLHHSWRPDGVFKRPTGVTVDPLGRVAVSDRETHRLYYWNLADVLR